MRLISFLHWYQCFKILQNARKEKSFINLKYDEKKSWTNFSLLFFNTLLFFKSFVLWKNYRIFFHFSPLRENLFGIHLMKLWRKREKWSNGGGNSNEFIAMLRACCSFHYLLRKSTQHNFFHEFVCCMLRS